VIESVIAKQEYLDINYPQLISLQTLFPLKYSFSIPRRMSKPRTCPLYFFGTSPNFFSAVDFQSRIRLNALDPAEPRLAILLGCGSEAEIQSSIADCKSLLTYSSAHPKHTAHNQWGNTLAGINQLARADPNPSNVLFSLFELCSPSKSVTSCGVY
jgi:hypothetical protein